MSKSAYSVSLEALLAAQTTGHINKIIAALPVVDSEEYQLDYGDKVKGKWRPGHLHWLPVGLERGNSGRIKLAGEPVNPLAERLVNGMEAIIELARLRELKADPSKPMPQSPRDAVLRYFDLPRLDTIHKLPSEEQKAVRAKIAEVRKALKIELSHEKKEFAVRIRDVGMGQTPGRIHQTLLSLGQSDKADKPYMVGVFGQGGSSAFAASQYSVIVSRRAPDILQPGETDAVGWSIVKHIFPAGRRDNYFAYLAAGEDGAVPTFPAEAADKLGFKHGSQFCHIAYNFGGSQSAVARSMYQSLNHVLFSPILPYDLFALKSDPEQMLGTANRLARQVKLLGKDSTLDKAFAPQAVN